MTGAGAQPGPASRGTQGSRAGAVSVSRAVAAFLLAGLVVMTVDAALLAWAEQRNATSEAIRDARTLTSLEATDVVGPWLTEAALDPGPEQRALDQVVRERVLGARIVRVKIWDATGRVRYSDDQSLIGRQFPLGADERRALATGGADAAVTHLSAAENRDERHFGRLLQVYQGVRTRAGTPLLFETYQPYTLISTASHRLLVTGLPVLLAGLVLLYLLQAPLAYRMARRLRQSQEEQEALLLETLAASDRERAVIAADLHDGVVQGLAGVSFALAAAGERSAGRDPEAAGVMRSAARDLRRWVRELRSLVVTITPPALHAQGVGPSLTDLAATLEGRGIAVTLEVDDPGPLDPASEALLFRAAQEGVRNVIRHPEAGTASLALSRPDPEHVMLRLRDDGRGLGDPEARPRRRGSVGLDLLRQLTEAHGGRLAVQSLPGGGTELLLVLPAPALPRAAAAPPAVPEAHDATAVP